MLVRHLMDDNLDHSPRASAFIERLERGDVRVRTAESVVFETVFTLERSYRQPKARIREGLVEILDLQGILLPGKNTLLRAFDYYVDFNIPFVDAYHVALIERLGMTRILSFDCDYDRVPGIERIEPPPAPRA